MSEYQTATSLPALATVDTFRNQIIHTDALTLCASLPPGSVHCIVTSPPYFGLRNYGADGQIGLEDTPEAYIERLVALFREARRVLREDGTFWLNLGDSYAASSYIAGRNDENPEDIARRASLYATGKPKALSGGNKPTKLNITANLPPKNLLGIPWRVALALQADDWILRSDIIWAKPNPMPEGVTDRPTKAHEYVFLFAKSPRYFYDADAIREKISDWTVKRWPNGPTRVNPSPQGVNAANVEGESSFGYNPDGRNKRSVWTVTTQPYSEAHFATFPPKLIEPMIKAGCPKGGLVLDMFMGAGTTALVAKGLGRDYIGCDLNAEYIKLAEYRVSTEFGKRRKREPEPLETLPLFAGVSVNA